MPDTIYKIQISDGTANPVQGIAGTLITITANSKANIGKAFKQWVQVQGGAVLENAQSETTTFTMPRSDVVIGAEYKDVSIDVLVRNGSYVSSSGKNNYYGSTITITANDRSKEGLKFVEWKVISGDVVLTDASASKTTFLADTKNVILEATYDYEIYQASIGFGLASSYSGKIGDTITIEAFDRSEEGKVFSKWVFNVGSPKDYYSPTTTITFGADRLDGWAEYTDIPRTYKITYGTADKKSAIKDEKVTITATDRTPEGYKFKTWKFISGDTTLNDLTSPTTFFIVNLTDVEVEAEYDFIEYAITTKNATSDKATAHLGEIVTLTAEDKTDSNLKFSEWEILKGLINIPQTNPASFTMIPSEVEIEAKYVQKSKPLDQSNYVSVSGIPDKLYGLIESKVAFSKNDYTNSGDREMTFEWSTPEDGQQGALLRDTLYHVVEASLVVSKNQNDE